MLPPEFVLCVGTLEPRKNLERLIMALGELHRRGRRVPLVLVEVLGWAAANGWGVTGLVRSSLVGGDGNVEYLVWLRHGAASANVAALIDAAL